ncbi:MAG: glycoside hydrolase N-terminal domain-containing protein, partial [Clostridiales bacterium]|nr:glycoside hydrolase N-terminal domain-containing protein [Clostridiales bacterium]
MFAGLKRLFCVTLVVCQLFLLGACSYERGNGTAMILDSGTYRVYSSDYSQVTAKKQTGKKMQAWRDGFVTGNGDNGSVNAGSPYSDTFIYQNIHFIMPCETIREAPDISDELDTVRQAVVNGEDYLTDNDWYSVYSFHPGGQLRLTQEQRRYWDYIRWCDYETGEVGVSYTDKNGTWSRKTFTSRTDNVTITEITQSDTGEKVDLLLSFDDISKMYNFGNNAEAGMQYKKLVDADASYLAQ